MTDEGFKAAGALPDDQATVYTALVVPQSVSMRAAPVVGDRVGKYVIERTLGRGGMGVVVAARHEQLDEVVAVKLLHPKAAKDKIQRERFVREARATVRIKSEHVVRVLDAGVEEATGAPFIVMEYLDGHDVGQVLKQSGRMPFQMAVDCIIQICEAVAAAHALGIIHRDLKPSNFFLTKRADGTSLVKVLDFGISKAAQEDGMPDPRLTETQAVFGSPTYMSPEQIRSSKNVDPRSDVWSLGVALFELLTCKVPFVADNVAGLLASVIADAPFRPTVFVADLPPELEAIILACLEKDPARRIGSAAELAARLAPFATEDGALIAHRIDRAARGMGSSQSIPPPPPLTGPGLPGAMPSAPFLGVAFGTTGSDLSATGPSATRAQKNTARTVGIVAGAIGVIALLVGGTLGVVRMRARDKAEASTVTRGSEAAPSVAPPPETTAVIATSTPPAVAAQASQVPVASAAPPTTGKRGKQGPGHSRAGASANVPGAPPPAPPPSTNLDSRF